MLFSAKTYYFSLKPNKIVTGGTAYFCGGMDTFPTYRSATRKYAISTDAVTAGPSIITGTGSTAVGYNSGKMSGTAFANGTTGLLAGGQTPTGTDNIAAQLSGRSIKITISTDATAAATNLAVGWRFAQGTTDGVRGVRMGGYYSTNSGASTQNIISKYLWSSDVWTVNAATVANPITNGGIHGNAEFAYRASGFNEQSVSANILYTNKWIWSSDTLRSISSVLDEQMGQACCTGNQEEVVIMGGINSAGTALNRVKSIIMLTDSRTNRTNLSANAVGVADAAGADDFGIFSFDRATSGSTRKYDYSADTYITSTNLIASLNIQGVMAFHSAQIS